MRRTTILFLVFALLWTAGCMSTATKPADFDLKIINGRIVDGTGSPWFRADVGIRGDTVAVLGDLSTSTAKKVVDAEDRIVAPGFIDLLGQSQGSVLVDPRLEGKIRQGVTTEVTGEGHSPAPLSAAMIAERNAADPTGLQITWRSLGDYMHFVEKRGTALNFAFFVGASNPRSMIIGAINRDPTEAEMKEMEQIIGQAMQDGAIGLSTSLIYIPAVFSKTEEIVRLARVAASYGGVYFTHIRDEGDGIDAALDEAFRIGTEARIPVNIWHLKITGLKNWGRMPEIISRIEAARAAGLDVAANVYPYIASSTGLSARLPNWALEGGYSAFLERLKVPETRQLIREELASTIISRGGPSVILVSRIPNPELAKYERRRLDEIAAMMNVEPVDAMLALYASSRYSPSAIFFSMNEDDLRYALKQWFVSVGADSGAVVGEGRNAGAHPRAYGTFPRVIGHYVREVKLFRLEEAVRKVTSQAAARANLDDRGILRSGMKADLVIFDPQTLRDVSTFEDPHHFSEGITDVIVNGIPVLEQGVMTGALPGRVLRGPGYRDLSRERRERN